MVYSVSVGYSDVDASYNSPDMLGNQSTILSSIGSCDGSNSILIESPESVSPRSVPVSPRSVPVSPAGYRYSQDLQSIRRRLDFSISPIPHSEGNVVNYASATFRMSLSSHNQPQPSAYKSCLVSEMNENSDAADAADAAKCGVCYDFLPKNSNRVYTICGHLFCVRCILIWNNHDNSCPLCRKPLVSEEEEEEMEMDDVPQDQDS